MNAPALIPSVPSGTPDSMAKTAPRRRLQGVQAPVHVLDTLERIRDVETDVGEAMGADSKVFLSDLVSDALEMYVREWLRENGDVPDATAERKEYVRRLAEKRAASLRAALKTH